MVSYKKIRQHIATANDNFCNETNVIWMVQ